MELNKSNILAIHTMVLSMLIRMKRDLGESREDIEKFKENIAEFSAIVGDFVSDERFNSEKIQGKLKFFIELEQKLSELSELFEEEKIDYDEQNWKA